MSAIVIFGGRVSGEGANAQHASRINAVTILPVEDCCRCVACSGSSTGATLTLAVTSLMTSLVLFAFVRVLGSL